MCNRRQWCCNVLTASLILFLAHSTVGEESASHPVARNVGEMSFGPVPGLPTCAPGALQSGNPTKGPFIILGKLTAGCTIPWHWHSANEHLMVVSGVARLEPKEGNPVSLRAGGFAM